MQSHLHMPRMARVVLPGMPHHVTQRGSRRWNVFQDDADRRSYVDIFRDSAERFRLRIHAYCLMTNHVHFVVIPESAEAIWRTFQRSQGMYAAKFNIKYGLCGHLWQARPIPASWTKSISGRRGGICGAQPGSGWDVPAGRGLCVVQRCRSLRFEKRLTFGRGGEMRSCNSKLEFVASWSRRFRHRPSDSRSDVHGPAMWRRRFRASRREHGRPLSGM